MSISTYTERGLQHVSSFPAEITEGAIEILGGLGCMFKQDAEVFVIGENFRVCCSNMLAAFQQQQTRKFSPITNTSASCLNMQPNPPKIADTHTIKE
jgi:hypothetical protein